jgi:hypothetical protein
MTAVVAGSAVAVSVTAIVRLGVAAVVSTSGSGADSRSADGRAASDASGGVRMSDASMIGVVRGGIRMAHVRRSRRGGGRSRDQHGYR